MVKLTLGQNICIQYEILSRKHQHVYKTYPINFQTSMTIQTTYLG